MIMSKTRLFMVMLGIVCGFVGSAAAEEGRTVEFEIMLPGGAEAVDFFPGRTSVTFDLPAGANFPVDFVESSDGMLASGRVEQLGERVRVELGMANGIVHRVRFTPSGISLELRERFLDVDNVEEGAERYTLGPYDLLKVTILNHPDLSGELSVSREGRIVAPLIGEMVAAGLTPTELATDMAHHLGRGFLVDPKVDISVEKFRSQWVMVNGEVRNPGRVFLQGGATLKEAISDANGFIETSGDEILISRDSLQGTEMIQVDREEFENGQTDPTVHHGDIITVKGVEFAFVNGEVRNPTRVRIERGLTLMQAITMASGLTDWANRKSVKILPGGGGEPREYNLKAIQDGKVADPQLRASDVVVVERRFF